MSGARAPHVSAWFGEQRRDTAQAGAGHWHWHSYVGVGLVAGLRMAEGVTKVVGMARGSNFILSSRMSRCHSPWCWWNAVILSHRGSKASRRHTTG